MALKKNKPSKSVISGGNGYLFCSHCGGYYQLKKGESPRDFVRCECGNPLEFCKSQKQLDAMIFNLNRNKEVFSLFETRILERRKNLKDIFPEIEIGDDFIKNMQEEEGLWDILDMETELNSQKKYLNIILEQERLMNSIEAKKIRVRNPSYIDVLMEVFEKTDPINILSISIVLMIIILVLAVLMS